MCVLVDELESKSFLDFHLNVIDHLSILLLLKSTHHTLRWLEHHQHLSFSLSLHELSELEEERDVVVHSSIAKPLSLVPGDDFVLDCSLS